jgi:hypothetical protein
MDDFVLADFRTNFTEFADTTKYPDTMVNFWAGLADLQLNVRRWGDRRPYGMALFVAHNVALAYQNTISGTPGAGQGLTAGENVGPVSHSLDTGSVVEQDGGNWNETTYGRQFIRLSRIVGIGAIQV